MNVRLDHQQLGQRFQGVSRESYLFIYNIMKCITCTNALYVLYVLATGIVDGDPSLAFRIPLWIASFAAMMMTYFAMSTGMIIIAHRLTIHDIIVPFIKMVIESSLFLILIVGSNQKSTLWHHWYLVFALFAAVSHIKLRYIGSMLKQEYYAQGFDGLLDLYKSSIQKDITGSGINAIMWVLTWAVLNFILIPRYPSLATWHAFLGLVVIAIMVKIMRDTQKMRQMLYSHIDLMSQSIDIELRS